MKRKTANIDIRVEPKLVEKIDAWRAQRVQPSRSAAIVCMPGHFLAHDAPELNGCWKGPLKQGLTRYYEVRDIGPGELCSDRGEPDRNNLRTGEL
jgi:hypothetical protein